MSRPSPNLEVAVVGGSDVDDDELAYDKVLSIRQGKAKTRNIAKLPREILRFIFTHVLLLTQRTPGIGSAWDSEPELWQQREVFVTARLAAAGLNLIAVCPSWHRALNDHEFWRNACHALDPADIYSQYLAAWSANAGSAQAQRKLSRTSDTYRLLLNFWCLPCRINKPFAAQAVGNVRKWMPTQHLQLAGVCRDHKFNHVCAVCLRESAQLAPQESPYEPGVAESDDEDMFPGLTATCSTCRQDVLCNLLEHEGILHQLGGRSFDKTEYDLKLNLEAYIDIAEGDATTLCILAKERLWLREHTRMREMMAQAVAAQRYADGEDADMLAEEDDDEMDLDISWAEESTARELALGEWARTRILEGVWTAPADDARSLLRAQQGSASMPVGTHQEHEGPHPVRAHAPVPAAGLAHGISRSYWNAMRQLLWPAMQNVARRLLLACGNDVIHAQEEACNIMREPNLAYWVVERCREEKSWRHPVAPPPGHVAQHDPHIGHRHHRASSSSASTSSGERSPTSPTSTSTLRTTPDGSPEPLGGLVAHNVPWVPDPSVLLDNTSTWSETRHVLARCWRDACQFLWSESGECTCAACTRLLYAQQLALAPAPEPILLVPSHGTKRRSEEMSSDGELLSEHERDATIQPGYKRQRTDSLDSNRARAASNEVVPDPDADGDADVDVDGERWDTDSDVFDSDGRMRTPGPRTPPRGGARTVPLPPPPTGRSGKRTYSVAMGPEEEEEEEEEYEEEEQMEEVVVEIGEYEQDAPGGNGFFDDQRDLEDVLAQTTGAGT
ncbi:hypothetical protein EXIGLDRAFT_762700 [Exidia glandulosa HHB12029]|uniref:Uncharacterized protein n=1 Tax=Exidia glandulosa HHB12029 TaxID=1314781 RepID=A0A165MKK8_EXIGL|nr:hypothetical protein EXIGLDRAFT_762700 [Exidia glandulosa HHB12029]